MNLNTYKQNIRSRLIKCAEIYRCVFLEYDYLIYSEGFVANQYYIVNAQEDNFAHLTGVKHMSSAYGFYRDCAGNSLCESDFDVSDTNCNRKSTKGTVRRKLQAFGEISDFFSKPLKAEEKFVKGLVTCVVGTTDGKITLGFVNSPNVRPKSLLKGNLLSPLKAVDVSLVLRRVKRTGEFNVVLQGDNAALLSLLSKCLRYNAKAPKDNDLRNLN